MMICLDQIVSRSHVLKMVEKIRASDEAGISPKEENPYKILFFLVIFKYYVEVE